MSGKRLVILGLARQGRALARFAARVGAEVVISDLRPPSALADSVAALRELEIEFVLGEHPLSLLEGTDLLAPSGGVPLSAPIVVAAQEKGITLTNDSLEFARRSPAPLIGVTGSAGKTTTTALLGAIGRTSGAPTWVGGNIGNPLIEHVESISAGDLVVQELSSFQLELWDRSPAVAAVLNITPNHLDRHGTMAAYRAAKANIVRHQEEGDVAVLCADDPGAMALATLVKGRLRTFSARQPVQDGAYLAAEQVWLAAGGERQPLFPASDIPLRGTHNVLNVLAAVTVADSAGISAAAIHQAVAAFQPVPHRLEPVAISDGVQYVNDSIATAPERALAAIDAFDEPLVLLAGGRDKNMVWDEWATRVSARARHVVLFGELAPQLAALLASQPEPPSLTRVKTLAEAVAAARRVARPGEVVLLAPGGTSFDAYGDFEERGEDFRHLVGAFAREMEQA
ncbi:MAG: UDP-N-acetylmuramoyl-L-alanine--D-glutamate ligase [Anaerolineae bacterium]|nr:UDP-N-acetylmuramoyl-L-alanine--D-glutamate ligase [Anaerolineae bacterium]